MPGIAGVDEAGRGSLAGPVVAAAVVLPPRCVIAGIRDSKLLSANRRENLAETIHAHPTFSELIAMAARIASAQ